MYMANAPWCFGRQLPRRDACPATRTSTRSLSLRRLGPPARALRKGGWTSSFASQAQNGYAEDQRWPACDMNDITFAGPSLVSVATISRGCFDFGSELGELFDRLVTFVLALGKEVLAEHWAVRTALPARDATGPTTSSKRSSCSTSG